MSYTPNPIPTGHILLDPQIIELAELLAKNTHEVWAQERIAQGWIYGAQRNDEKKEHPCLVPYEELPESEKVYDRQTALQTLKAITAMGFSISKGVE
jgi:ryanodine receptor 2